MGFDKGDKAPTLYLPLITVYRRALRRSGAMEEESFLPVCQTPMVK